MDNLVNFENSTLFMEDYRPVGGGLSMKDLRQSPLFSVKKFNDAIFMGELIEKSGLREGTGIMVYKNGRIYEGKWAKDSRSGKGYE